VARPRAGRSGPSPEEIQARARAWVERGCADQGIPMKISEPQTVATVVAILAQGRQAAMRRDSSKRL
jgi:hypothetical protein